MDFDNEERVIGDSADIGADEVACEDVSNPYDWNADGFVNLVEFSTLSAAWLGHDPNDPGIITDPNFIGHPDYADPETLARWDELWDPLYNFDDTGDSAYTIDSADLMEFTENGYWLWIACWKQA